MMAKASARTLLLSLLLVASGCSQWRYELGDALDADYLQRARGESLAEVLATLGPPLRFTTADDQLFMAWESWRISQSALGVSLGFAGADFLSVDVGNARIRGDYLLLGFDAQRRVSAAARATRDDSLGSGAAIQPFYGFVSVVSVEDLLRDLPQHVWGAGMLRPLPGVLNNPQSPGLGDSGMEQRGTPAGAGARSLEWLE